MIDLGHSGGSGAGELAHGESIAAQRIDHRPRHHHAAHGRIVRRRAGGQRDRRIARIVRPHGDQHGELPAARLAGQSDQVRTGLERASVELRPAHRMVDVRDRGRIGVVVARAEVERDRHDAVRGHGLVAQPLVGAVAHAPGAAVHLDQRRKRPLAARTEHARQQRLVAVAKVLDVLDVELMWLRVEELGIADCSCHGGPLVVRRTRRIPSGNRVRIRSGPATPTSA